MKLNKSMGIYCLKICPVCGNIGPRLINRCGPCEEAHQRTEKERQDREDRRCKIEQRRANGFDAGWD